MKRIPWINSQLLFHFMTLISLFLLLLVALTQINPLTSLPARDNGFFLYAGNQIVKGKLLYIDVWDSKGPGVFYANALGLWLAHGSRWGVWFLEFLTASVAVLIGFYIAKKEWGTLPAIVGAGSFIFGLTTVLERGNFTEEYSLFFSFLAILIFWKMSQISRYKFIAYLILGCLLGINFLFRANNIGVIISLASATVFLHLFQSNIKSVFRFIAFFVSGLLIAFSFVAIYFLYLGTLDEMIYASIIYNFSYAGGNLDMLGTLRRGIQLLGFPTAVALIGYFSIVLNLVKQKSYPALLLYGLLDLPLEWFLSSLSGRMYDHYFISWLPVIWLLSSFGIYIIVKKLFLLNYLVQIERYMVFAFFIFSISASMLLNDGLSLYSASFQRLLFQRSLGIEIVDPVSQYIRQNSSTTDLVWTWGVDAGINFLSRRESPTALIFYPLFVPSPRLDNMAEQVYQDLVTKRPLYIVDVYFRIDQFPSLDPVIRARQISAGKKWVLTVKNVPEIFKFVEENYFMDRRFDKIELFKRKD